MERNYRRLGVILKWFPEIFATSLYSHQITCNIYVNKKDTVSKLGKYKFEVTNDGNAIGQIHYQRGDITIALCFKD